MKRLLIANRGEIARRVIRTAHRMDIETVAVHSDADREALHVREATLAFALGGDASADSYLRIDKLVAAASATGADAVHPGYGFLSENADFAQAVIDAGFTWVGPPPDAIRALGSKSGAKKIAQAHGVPCLPGYFGDDLSDARFADEAARIGYPVMVKAVAGGGGRGMRLVREPQSLQAALQSARSEARAAFGSDALLIERALTSPRHVEVQVFADAHGNVIHLGERDCSVQRRHQKLIEESPGPAVDAALRERMGRCAVDLARAAGYVGAGTVEFLLDDSASLVARASEATPGNFFLMEMNTRLQVEHPVTEMRTGLDLVEWQLRIARGEPLPLKQDEVRFEGHAIEVRLCAEDANFMPQAGAMVRFREPPDCAVAPSGLRGQDEPSLRFDHALFDGCSVPPHYDSMLGKLIAHAPTRGQAIERLRNALAGTELLGLATNRGLLQACLQHPEFAAGNAGIDFLALHGEEIRTLLQKEEQEIQSWCAVAALFVLNSGPSGLPCPFPRPMRVRRGRTVADLAVRELNKGTLELVSGDRTQAVSLGSGVEGRNAVTIDGVRQDVSCVPLGTGGWHVQCGGTDAILEDASFEPAVRAGRGSGASELKAPFSGKVIAIYARANTAATRGAPLVVIESMKLEHALSTSSDATVADVLVHAGQQVAPGQVLLRFATP